MPDPSDQNNGREKKDFGKQKAQKLHRHNDDRHKYKKNGATKNNSIDIAVKTEIITQTAEIFL
jgi:hypothetical protein